MQPAFIRVEPQRHSNDCAVCCFVMLCGVSYEAALVAIAGVDQKLGTNGLYLTQIKKAAKSMGIKLKTVPKGKYDLHNTVGILSVRFPSKLEHAVILFRGMVVDPDGGIVWDDVDAYLQDAEARIVGSLLVLA